MTKMGVAIMRVGSYGKAENMLKTLVFRGV